MKHSNTSIAGQITNGAKYWDGSIIEVISSTNSFVTVLLHFDGKTVERKWKKTSIINLA